jgi:hypothetical protein
MNYEDYDDPLITYDDFSFSYNYPYQFVSSFVISTIFFSIFIFYQAKSLFFLFSIFWAIGLEEGLENLDKSLKLDLTRMRYRDHAMLMITFIFLPHCLERSQEVRVVQCSVQKDQ